MATLDAEGRVVSVTVTESRFTPEERALLIASRRAEQVLIGEHGLPLSEAMDDKNQFAYEGTGPRTDWAQKAIDDRVKAYKAQHPDADTHALRFGVKRR